MFDKWILATKAKVAQVTKWMFIWWIVSDYLLRTGYETKPFIYNVWFNLLPIYEVCFTGIILVMMKPRLEHFILFHAH